MVWPEYPARKPARARSRRWRAESALTWTSSPNRSTPVARARMVVVVCMAALLWEMDDVIHPTTTPSVHQGTLMSWIP